MFEGVNEKLERVGYFLSHLKTLAEDAGDLAYIKRDKQQEMRANLDAFFFEIISAKDYFLQGIIDWYGLTSLKVKVTQRKHLIKELERRGLKAASEVVTRIEKLLSSNNLRPDQKLRDDQDSWLWRLNNYRNSATHQELLHLGHEVKATITVEKHSFDKIRQGEPVIKLIYEGQKKEISPDVPRVDIPRENIKTYLFKDPRDPSQGNADIEVIPYCEQSLTQMKELLERLYSELALE